MDLKQVEQLLNKYWEGETSIDEENALQQFFSFGDVPSHLQVYSELFKSEEITLNPELGLDFDQEVLAKIGDSKTNNNRNFLRIAAIGIILIATAIGLFNLNKTESQNIVQQDTFDNPELALEETKKAFVMISEAMNKGQQPVLKISKLDRANKKVARTFGYTSQLPTIK